MNYKYEERLLDTARRFFATCPYPICENNTPFTHDEARVLRSFFTNLDRRVYFMHSLPENIGTALLARFSRIKNSRGLRGIFVDEYLPQALAEFLKETERDFEGDGEKFIKQKGIKNLRSFLCYSEETRHEFENFLHQMATNPEYVMLFADSKKVSKFLARWLDSYGHNSIARMAGIWLCCENISILTAKSIEWNRPGSGFIELSTRYVDRSKSGCYPIEDELEKGWGISPDRIRESNNLSFQLYRELSGDNFDGPFPNFLRQTYGHIYNGYPKDLEAGIVGETCDVLGCLLPASSLTSVGISLSGEAFTQLLKHLLLDHAPENIALAEFIAEESRKVGCHQFARHFEPSEWEIAMWRYLDERHFQALARQGISQAQPLVQMRHPFEEILTLSMGMQYDLSLTTDLNVLLPSMIKNLPVRKEHDKLPRFFELVTWTFRGLMSFRGWRDLQRQSFCTHLRTHLSPLLGFYDYDKPKPPELDEAFGTLAAHNLETFEIMNEKEVPDILMQYPMALGNMVGFLIGGNLRQLEFCDWQRAKYSVNHEVRQVFLSIDDNLRKIFPWWQTLSRADMTTSYVFARGNKAFPLDP